MCPKNIFHPKGEKNAISMSNYQLRRYWYWNENVFIEKKCSTKNATWTITLWWNSLIERFSNYIIRIGWSISINDNDNRWTKKRKETVFMVLLFSSHYYGHIKSSHLIDGKTWRENKKRKVEKCGTILSIALRGVLFDSKRKCFYKWIEQENVECE
jgi:hypothetical protein